MVACDGLENMATITFAPNDAYNYMLQKNVMYYFGVWLQNPTVASKFGWFSMDFETETSGPVEAYQIRTML